MSNQLQLPSASEGVNVRINGTNLSDYLGQQASSHESRYSFNLMSFAQISRLQPGSAKSSTLGFSGFPLTHQTAGEKCAQFVSQRIVEICEQFNTIEWFSHRFFLSHTAEWSRWTPRGLTSHSSEGASFTKLGQDAWKASCDSQMARAMSVPFSGSRNVLTKMIPGCFLISSPNSYILWINSSSFSGCG